MDTYHNFSNEDVAVVPDLCSICGSGPGQDVQYGSRERAWSASIAELQTATDNGCRLCALLLDAAITSSEKDLDLNVDDGFSFLTFEVDWPMANGGSRKALYMLIEHDAFKDSMAFDSFEVFQASFNHTGHAQDVWSEPASSLRDYPILPEDPASIMMATQVSAWMEECNGSHSKCGKAHQVRLPRRILELQDTMVVLRDNQHGKLRGTYACLSHCWGSKGPSTKLTMSTEKKLSEGLALTALPKTFEEVARVCMSLGIQYLWIDALCIRQDDPNDWVEAAATMASIYEDASITIMALCSRNSDDGLRPQHNDTLKVMSLQNHDAYIRRRSWEDINMATCYLFREPTWPLMTRAWIYQERLLSPRKLYFAGYQLIWDCMNGRKTQDLSHELTSVHGSAAVPQGFLDSSRSLDGRWRDIVEMYGSMELTYETDRLPAVAALAERMMQIRQTHQYFAGIWEESLLADIGWSKKSHGLQRCRKSETPSWSWVSAGSIFYSFREPLMAPNVEVVDLKYTRLGHPHLGRVNDAVLTLRGPIFEIDMPYGSVYERTWLTSTNAPGRNLASLNDQPEYRISTFGDYDSRGAAPGFDKRCEALVLYDRDMQEGSRSRSKGYGIILLKVSEEEYTRVGSFLILVPDDTTDQVRQEIIDNFIRQLPITEVKII